MTKAYVGSRREGAADKQTGPSPCPRVAALLRRVLHDDRSDYSPLHLRRLDGRSEECHEFEDVELKGLKHAAVICNERVLTEPKQF